MPQIRVVLDGQKITVEGIGFVGSACEAATKAIEEALGKVTSRDLKPEYFVNVETSDQTVAEG